MMVASTITATGEKIMGTCQSNPEAGVKMQAIEIGNLLDRSIEPGASCDTLLRLSPLIHSPNAPTASLSVVIRAAVRFRLGLTICPPAYNAQLSIIIRVFSLASLLCWAIP
jgi:hypothetical protein